MERIARGRWRLCLAGLAVAVAFGLQPAMAMPPRANQAAQPTANQPAQLSPSAPSAPTVPSNWFGPEGLSSTLQLLLLSAVLSLAPALVLMTTCFVRLVVVLYLLRQALGTSQLPPNQVLTALALFLTVLVMTPVWQQTYDEAIQPYCAKQISGEEAWQRGTAPMRRFMSAQIERAGNSEDVWLFLEYVPGHSEPQTYADVPLQALAPAFVLSELKTAFLIGFQIYLPFLIIDLVVAAVLTGMGMLMLPPVLVSMPFKLLLFVLVDGWRLVVGGLLESIAVVG